MKLLLAVAALALSAAPAQAYTASNGFAASDFVTGFTPSACCDDGAGPAGPIGVAFDPSGNLYVTNLVDKKLYRFGPGGGVAGPATELHGAYAGDPKGLTFGLDGRLYMADGSAVQELNPVNGDILRKVIDFAGALALATDPITGDLAVSGSGTTIGHVVSPASGSSLVDYVTGVAGVDGVTFAPDGTLYAARNAAGKLISHEFGAPTGTITEIADIPNLDGIAVGVGPAGRFLVTARTTGIITKVDLSQTPAAKVDILTGGTRGDFVAVGFDGCMYATQTSSIIRITNAGGSCSFIPTTPEDVPPSTTAVPSPAANAAGWNRGDVTVTLHAVDGPPPQGSGIERILTILTGASDETVASAGPDGVRTITAEKATTVNYRARDNSGNEETNKALTVKIDRTPPVITLTDAPGEGQTVTAGTAVAPRVACTDAVSGAASCTGLEPIDTSSSGPRTIRLAATDIAGNSATLERHFVIVAAPAPAPTPTPAPTVAALPSFAQVVVLPSARKCVSRRRFRIRLRTPRGEAVVKATVLVNGRRVKVVRGSRLRAPVDLRGLPKGRFTVKITLTTASGRTVTGSRRYRTCVPKRR
jgi:hypothetical protein